MKNKYLFSLLSDQEKRLLEGKKLNIELVFASGLISRPFEAVISNRKVRAEFTVSNTGFCEVTYSDHPGRPIDNFKISEPKIVFGGKQKQITKFKYNPKKCRGTIWFEL